MISPGGNDVVATNAYFVGVVGRRQQGLHPLRGGADRRRHRQVPGHLRVSAAGRSRGCRTGPNGGNGADARVLRRRLGGRHARLLRDVRVAGRGRHRREHRRVRALRRGDVPDQRRGERRQRPLRRDLPGGLAGREQRSSSARRSRCCRPTPTARRRVLGERARHRHGARSTRSRTTRRTSASQAFGPGRRLRLRPAQLRADRPSAWTTTPTRRWPTRRSSRASPRAPATRSPRPCRPAGTRRRRPATTAARPARIDVNAGQDVTCTFTEPEAGPDRAWCSTPVPNDAQDFGFTAGGGLSPGELLARRRLRRHAVEHDRVHRRAVGARVLARARSAAARLGAGRARPAATAARSRTSASPPGRPSPARSPTTSRAGSSSSRTPSPTTRRTSTSPRAAASRRRASSSTTTATPRSSGSRTSTTWRRARGYSLSESVPSGWVQANASCDDGSPVSNINVSPGEVDHLHVHEPQARPDRGREGRAARTTRRTSASRPAAACRRPASSSTTTRTATLSNTRTFTNITPGSGYSVSETVPVGLGPVERDLQRRQPDLEHQRRARARPSPARSRTTSGARS